MEKAQSFAKEHGLYFEETSALTNSKVNDTFDNLVNCIFFDK